MANEENIAAALAALQEAQAQVSHLEQQMQGRSAAECVSLLRTLAAARHRVADAELHLADVAGEGEST